MSLHETDDVRATMDAMLFENAAFNLTGINMYAHQTLHGLGSNTEPEPSPFDPTRDMHPDQGNLDSGGRQPGISIGYSLLEKRDEDKKPWYEISLFNPFRIAFHGLKVPVLGLMSIVIERTKYIGVVVYSLLYMSLPTLAWFLGIDSSRFTVKKYTTFKPPSDGAFSVLRCEVCNLWKCDPFFANDELTKTNFWLGCLCDFEANQTRPFKDARSLVGDSIYANNVRYTSYAEIAAGLKATITCTHEDHGSVAVDVGHVPEPTLDGLYLLQPDRQWKASDRHGGLRCHIDHPTNWHGLHPAVVSGCITGSTKAPAPFYSVFIMTVRRWMEFTACYAEDDTVLLMGLSIDRVKYYQHRNVSTIILHFEEALPSVLQNTYKTCDFSKTRFFRVPYLGFHGRCVTMWRIVLMIANNSPIRLIVVNQATPPNEQVYVDHLRNSPYDIVSACGGNLVPFYGGAGCIKGRTANFSWIPLATRFYWGANIYGWDEMFIAYNFKVVVYASRALFGKAVMAGTVNYKIREPEVALVITDDVDFPSKIPVIEWSRQSIYWINRLAGADVDSGRLTFWHVWSDPRPTFSEASIHPRYHTPEGEALKPQWYKEVNISDEYPKITRIVAPGDNILQELVVSLGGVSLFTIGTKGDILPFRALGKYISSFKVPVTLYILNDPDEGKILLNDALGNTESGKAVGLFNRARSLALENITGASICHSALWIGDVPSLTLTPPPDLVYTRTVGGGLVASIGAALMGVWFVDSGRIGPYTGPRIVPTSHNGKDFLEARQNRKKIPYGAVWGSDGKPAPGFEDVPVIPDGDHLELFRDYANIICHGGAGTVSTIAAAGARAIVPVGGLDRARRNPYDAGLGLVPGADPDNIWLILADQDVRFLAFWLRKNFLKPWKLWQFYGFPGFGWTAFRMLMLFFVYNKAKAGTAVATEPLVVLFNVLGLKSNSPPKYIALLCFAKIIDLVLDYLNISYMRILSTFVSYNIRMSISPVGLYLAWNYNIGTGLAYTFLSPWVYQTVQHWGQAFSNTVLGYEPKPMPDGEIEPPVYFEFVPTLWNGIPIVHTALVCPGLNERFEGVQQGRLYVLQIVDGPPKSSILIPSHISWSEVRAIPKYAGVYSLAWNCQTAIALAFIRRRTSLGVGGIFVNGTAVFAAAIYSVNALVATFAWGVSQLIPTHISPNLAKPSSLALAGDILGSLWNQTSTLGYWEPALVLHWWRRMYLPF